MKSASLLALRLSTGLLLVVWGSLRLIMPETGPGLASTYYGGIMSAQSLQVAFGAAEVLLGLLVCLGLFRRVVYPLQSLVLVLGTLAIGKYLLDPLGLWLLDRESSQILFFPSLTVAAATIVLIAFRDFDRLSLDARIGRAKD